MVLKSVRESRIFADNSGLYFLKHATIKWTQVESRGRKGIQTRQTQTMYIVEINLRRKKVAKKRVYLFILKNRNCIAHHKNLRRYNPPMENGHKVVFM